MAHLGGRTQRGFLLESSESGAVARKAAPPEDPMISLPNRKAWPALLALVALILLGAGCKDFFTDPKVTSIAVTADQPSVTVGGTDQLQAIATYDDNSKKDVTGSVKWSASPTGVVTINTSGLATGVTAGSATITAKSGIITSSTATIVVGTLTSIDISPANTTISRASSGTQQFTATGHYSPGSFTQDITSSVTFTASTVDITFTSGTPGLGTIVSLPTTNPITITATSSAATGSVQGTTNLTINP